jgi:hypothetical protein
MISSPILNYPIKTIIRTEGKGLGIMKKGDKISLTTMKKHVTQCYICRHPDRKDIEKDYVHCIPWNDIQRRYDIKDRHTIENHAIVTDLWKKRDRKHFYWKIIERFDYNKVSGDMAIEAGKQLDRLEHKVDANPVPSNISIVYSFDAMRKDGRSLTDQNRIRAITDPTEIPPESKEISPL